MARAGPTPVPAPTAAVPAPQGISTSPPHLDARRALIVSSFVLPACGRRRAVRRHRLDAPGRARLGRPRPGVQATRGGRSGRRHLPTRFLPPGVGPCRSAAARSLAGDRLRGRGRRERSRNLCPTSRHLRRRLRGRQCDLRSARSGAPFTTSSLVYHRLLGSAFEWLVVRVALRLSLPISLSRAGVGRRAPALRSRGRRTSLSAARPAARDAPLPPPRRAARVTWVGRLYREKNPLLAVEIVERVRRKPGRDPPRLRQRRSLARALAAGARKAVARSLRPAQLEARSRKPRLQATSASRRHCGTRLRSQSWSRSARGIPVVSSQGRATRPRTTSMGRSDRSASTKPIATRCRGNPRARVLVHASAGGVRRERGSPARPPRAGPGTADRARPDLRPSAGRTVAVRERAGTQPDRASKRGARLEQRARRSSSGPR